MKQNKTSDHFNAGFIHGMVWGTDWPQINTAEKLHDVMVQVLRPEVRDSYLQIVERAVADGIEEQRIRDAVAERIPGLGSDPHEMG